MSQYPPEPKVKLGVLYQKRSAKGTDYMLGTFGSFKLLILPSNDTPPGGDPQWNIFVSERHPKPDGQQAQAAPLLPYPAQAALQATQQGFHASGRQSAYRQQERPLGAPQVHDDNDRERR
ncbi:MAG: hypothetical protein H7838_11125 [Magnetococcus sp. DMHC-8]